MEQMVIDRNLISALINPKDTENKWVYDLPEEIYHADKTAVNSSSLKWIDRSPAAFYKAFVKGEKPEANKSMKYGKLAHMAILEGKLFRERHIVLPDFGDMRSSKNRDKKKDYIAEVTQSFTNAVFVVQDEFDHIMDTIDSLMSHQEALRLLSNGAAEVTGYFICPITGIRKRIRLDFLSYNLHCLVDVKTTRDIQWESLRKTFEALRYDFQFSNYDHGIEVISKKRPEFTAVIAIDNQFPYEVEVYEVDEMYKLTGKYEYEKASMKLLECINKMEFPKANKETICTEMSPWMFKKYQALGVL